MVMRRSYLVLLALDFLVVNPLRCNDAVTAVVDAVYPSPPWAEGTFATHVAAVCNFLLIPIVTI